MLFEVTRTSLWGDEKPYDKCVPIKLTRVETRTLKTPEEFNEKFSKREGRWLEKGTNHRINEDGYITRDMEKWDRWGIKIGSLRELMNFVDAVKNEVIIKKSMVDDKTPCLEIYDDYRE